MDPDTKRTFWDKQVELRAWIEAQAKPFHDELDRFERLWAHWVDIFPNWAYNNEMPNDNAGFDILRLSHLRNAYRRVPYPIRHFGVDSSEDEETGKIATNEAPKYHSIWDPSEPWWMLGMGETINIILKVRLDLVGVCSADADHSRTTTAPLPRITRRTTPTTSTGRQSTGRP